MFIVDSVLFLLFFGLLLMPTIIAINRNHKHPGWMLGLNLLFGWTIIVWLLLLIWACIGKKRTSK